MTESIIREYFGSKGLEVINRVTDFGIDLVFAIFILLIGFKICSLLIRMIKKVFVKSRMDQTLQTFLLSFFTIAFRIVVILMAIGKLGIGASSIIALLGSTGLAVGLSLQGSLSNIAGGVILLLLKPFEVGDYIYEAGSGKEGTVKAIGIIYTKLLTVENKLIMIPNGNLANTSITNVTSLANRIVELKVGVSYDADIKEVRDVIRTLIEEESDLVPDEPIRIFVDDFLDSSIRIGIRYTVTTTAYWESRWRVLEKIQERFREHDIVIPYNQLEVTMLS